MGTCSEKPSKVVRVVVLILGSVLRSLQCLHMFAASLENRVTANRAFPDLFRV